jgi:cytochrome c553
MAFSFSNRAEHPYEVTSMQTEKKYQWTDFGSDSTLFRLLFSTLLGCFVTQLAIAQPAAPTTTKFSASDLKFFESKVRPILVDKCYSCHSAEAEVAEGNLQVDSRDALLQGGVGGPAVIPGDPKHSLFIKAIEYTDPDFAMPPEDAGGKLSQDEIETLTKWVRMGLPDPRKRKSHVHEAKDYREIKEWWSFKSMGIEKAPDLSSTYLVNESQAIDRWPINDIDRWIAKGWEDKQIKTIASEASPSTLLRRIHLDLTGLVPTINEIESFEKEILSIGFDKAFEDRVDQLLASEQYSVHWARHWLDVARYAESTGKEINTTYPHAWRYRDWVVDAIKEDKPYDAFLREQIAGDLLPANSAKAKAKNQVATGFLALGAKSINEGNPRQFALDQADEQIDTVFQATMALTVSCARCHDHKFDPIPQQDYTAVAGIFLSTETHFGASGGRQGKNATDLIVAEGDHGLPVLAKTRTRAEIKELQEELKQVEESFAKMRGEFIKMRKANMASESSMNEKPNANQAKQIVRDRNRLEERKAEIQSILEEYQPDGTPRALIMGVTDKPRESKEGVRGKLVRKLANVDPKRPRNGFPTLGDSPLFARGDLELPGDKVKRGVPTTLGHSPQYDVSANESGRLQLARWITRPNNTFTARVAVNRVWAHLIGQGIVASVDNFGTTGNTPTHPELLDFLARSFIENGWSTKKLIRSIVLSRTYRLSTQYHQESYNIDPENTMLWRANSKRMTGEMLRDSVLSIAGSLDLQPIHGSAIARCKWRNAKTNNQ